VPLKIILLVDDEEADRVEVRGILHRQGYTVVEADNFQNAMNEFERYRDSIELLIADISLPGGNGCELAIAMRDRKPNLRALFVSGHVGAEVCRFYGLDVSDEHFLPKPFKAADLLSRVSQVMHSDEPFPKLHQQELGL
jgi:DNA-binding response OmpR family regulator